MSEPPYSAGIAWEINTQLIRSIPPTAIGSDTPRTHATKRGPTDDGVARSQTGTPNAHFSRITKSGLGAQKCSQIQALVRARSIPITLWCVLLKPK